MAVRRTFSSSSFDFAKCLPPLQVSKHLFEVELELRTSERTSVGLELACYTPIRAFSASDICL